MKVKLHFKYDCHYLIYLAGDEIIVAKTERIHRHPILEVSQGESFVFYFDGKECIAREGEVISSALFANNHTIFGRHHQDDSPLGIFCANGQCAQCMVIADGLAVKSCMTMVTPGMDVRSCVGLPELPEIPAAEPVFSAVETMECECLIIGGGPAGIAAAVELGKAGHRVILVDDKDRLGGKLVLQTHTFFGSIDDCHAGTRGIDIAEILKEELSSLETVEVFLNSTALGVFSDKVVGVIQGDRYFLVKPRVLLIATGAREKALVFPGWTLPGVYGAGAFQTLLNRDLVKPSQRIFIVGGGNVGLIAAYHALQAGITVVGLAEALPEPSGYKVHADKIRRLGVPLYLSHSVVKAEGDDSGVHSVTIGEVDKSFNLLPGTAKTFAVDTLLIAVGLTSIRELYDAARKADMKVYLAGDAGEIAEASAAMFGGKIAGLKIARELGDEVEIPEVWYSKEEILKSRPGMTHEFCPPELREGVFPVFHCTQEIPCNPCIDVCPKKGISIPGGDLMGIPEFSGECISCGKCVAICPGLAVTLVDFRKVEPGYAKVTVPFELLTSTFSTGSVVRALDTAGGFLADVEVIDVKSPRFADRTSLVVLKVPEKIAAEVAGIKIQEDSATRAVQENVSLPDAASDEIICNCMRVREGDIRRMIRDGVRDLNELKAELHVGMGSCNGKTCEQLIFRVFREEGVGFDEIIPFVSRNPIMEVSLGVFAGVE